MRRASAHSLCKRGPGPRRGSVRSLALVPVLMIGAWACGESADDPRLAELEARYGPRADTTGPPGGTSGGAAGAGTVTGGPDQGAPREPPAAAPAGDPPEQRPATRATGPPAAGRDTPPARAPTTPASSPGSSDTVRADRATGPAGPERQEVDVTELLAGAERAYGSLASLRASFVQVMEVPLLERTSSGTGIWYQKGQNRFRMDFDDPPDDEIVADGTYLWLYYPSQNANQVIRSELAAGETDSGTADLLARILSEARTSYDARYDGREPIDGVTMHVVTLEPIGRSPYRSVRIWIGRQDRLVRRFQIVERNESIRTVTLSDLEPNAALADSIFRFAVPAGADVFSG